jgi:hypothetical protein
LVAAVLTWAAVLCYFAGRDRSALGVVGATILVLLAIKIAVIAPTLSLAITPAGPKINNLQQDFQSLIWYDSAPCSACFSSGSEP